jgi:D-3-phosphoglycerate dehydrogenase
MKILVTPTSLQPQNSSKALEELRSFCSNLVFNPTGRPLTEDELIPLLIDCDGYIAGLDFITEKVIASCTKLKVISRYGVGYDRVDMRAAKARNITVTNTPGANAEAVAELTFALLLSVARKIPYLNDSTRNNEWIRSAGVELSGKTIGIIGLGAIGKIVARCAKGFNMNVMAYDPYLQESYCSEHQIENSTFDNLIQKADVITLHLPLNENTLHLIDKEAIKKMKASTIIINTSRGGIIDEAAAYIALQQGKLGGLGLDAFEVEPPGNSPLFNLNNVVVTPHTGAHTIEATLNMACMAVKNAIDILSGKNSPYIIS